MKGSPLVHVIQERLSTAGYSDLPTTFKVAGVEFAFTGAMHGRDGRALDLVLLFDTTTGDFGDQDGVRVRHRVEALSRALDITGSRYVVTVILAGAIPAPDIEALSETCRVLQVDGVTLNDEGNLLDETAERHLDDCIRILLPLTLPVPLAETEDGSGPALEQLVRALPAGINDELVEAVIAASISGDQAVTDAVALVINRAFQSEQGEDQP